MLLAHQRVEGMNFIPGGYSYPEWGIPNPGDEIQMTSGTEELAINSNPHVTRSSAGGEGIGLSSMSINLRMALQVEVVQRVSLVGELQLTPAVQREQGCYADDSKRTDGRTLERWPLGRL
jgi:hypothetical protein